MHTYKVNTGREAALQNQVGELKSTCAVLEERIDEMKDRAFGDANTISHLKEKYDEAKTNMALMTDELEKLRSLREASSAPCGCQAYRDLEEARGRAEGEVELLQREIERLKDILVEREDKWDALMRDKLALVAHGDRLLDENGDLEERNDASKATIQRLKDEVAQVNSELEELSKAYNDEYHETQVYKKAWREQRELVALRDDQIAMLERRLTMKNIDLSK